MWIERRIFGEAAGDLFTVVPLRTLDAAAAITRRARATVERALNRNGRTTTLSDPCPWCAGILTGRTKPYVTCDR